MDPKATARVEAFLVPGYVAADRPQPLLQHSKPVENITNTKKRQKSLPTRDSIINKYKNDLVSCWIDKSVQVNSWFKPKGFTLECKSLDNQHLPPGFTNVGHDRYQYNFTDPEAKQDKRHRTHSLPHTVSEGSRLLQQSLDCVSSLS